MHFFRKHSRYSRILDPIQIACTIRNPSQSEVRALCCVSPSLRKNIEDTAETWIPLQFKSLAQSGILHTIRRQKLSVSVCLCDATLKIQKRESCSLGENRRCTQFTCCITITPRLLNRLSTRTSGLHSSAIRWRLMAPSSARLCGD
jgi:hypothetical protein